jgi:hypothetical protein
VSVTTSYSAHGPALSLILDTEHLDQLVACSDGSMHRSTSRPLIQDPFLMSLPDAQQGAGVPRQPPQRGASLLYLVSPGGVAS